MARGMLPLPNNQLCSNIFQPPGNNVDNNLNINMSDQDHSPLMRQCLALLTKISAKVNRNTRLIDLMTNYIVTICQLSLLPLTPFIFPKYPPGFPLLFPLSIAPFALFTTLVLPVLLSMISFAFNLF